MTRKELSQIYYLTQDLERCEKNLAELRVSIQPKSQKITGIPFANTGSKSDPTADTAERIMQCIESIEGYRQAIIIRKATVFEWVNKLEDMFLKQIVQYRCIELLSWDEVAMRIGAGTTADSCRMYFNRNIPKR